MCSNGRAGLPGRRYEHIPVRLTEAIHGFSHSREALPGRCPNHELTAGDQ